MNAEGLARCVEAQTQFNSSQITGLLFLGLGYQAL